MCGFDHSISSKTNARLARHIERIFLQDWLEWDWKVIEVAYVLELAFAFELGQGQSEWQLDTSLRANNREIQTVNFPGYKLELIIAKIDAQDFRNYHSKPEIVKYQLRVEHSVR